MSRLRLVPPPPRQLTLDDLAAVPRPPEVALVEEALPLARQLEFMAQAMGPESGRVAAELVELLTDYRPQRPRRIA